MIGDPIQLSMDNDAVWVVQFSVRELDEDTGQYRTEGPYIWLMRTDPGKDTAYVKQEVVAEHNEVAMPQVTEADFTWHHVDLTVVMWR